VLDARAPYGRRLYFDVDGVKDDGWGKVENEALDDDDEEEGSADRNEVDMAEVIRLFFVIVDRRLVWEDMADIDIILMLLLFRYLLLS